MKIQFKFTLLHLIILAGFLIALGIGIVFYSQISNIMNYEVQAVSVAAEITKLQKATSLLISESILNEYMWEDWTKSYHQLHRKILEFLDNPYYRLLGAQSRKHHRSIAEIWNVQIVQEYRELTKLYEEVQTGDFLDQFSKYDLLSIREISIMELGNVSPEALQLSNVSNSILKFQNSLTIDLLKQTEESISTAQGTTNQIPRNMIIFLIIIFLSIQFTSLLICFRISKTFVKPIGLLKLESAEFAQGNYKANYHISTDDEIMDVSNKFKQIAEYIYKHLEAMKEILSYIGRSINEDAGNTEAEKLMLGHAVEQCGADAGIILKYSEGKLVFSTMEGSFPPLAAVSQELNRNDLIKEWFISHPVESGEGILGEILASAESRFIQNNNNQELPYNAERTSIHFINSALFVPIMISNELSGLIGLAITKNNAEFTELDYFFMQSYSEFMRIAMEYSQKFSLLVENQKANREIEVAAEIQKLLLPKKMPELIGAKVAAFSNAARGVSGNYFDIFTLDERKTALVIADISDRGFSATLMMVIVRTALRTISSPEKSPDQILNELNRIISSSPDLDRFAAISLIILDQSAGTLSYSNGAHYPLYIFRGETKKYRMFDTDGLPIGIDYQSNFEQKRIQLKANDYMIAFSEGLIEARNLEDETFGNERILRLVAHYSDLSPKDLISRLETYLERFTAGTAQLSDQTFLALKMN